MPVNTPHPEYDAMLPKWERCRDAAAGEDEIKARGTKYLPNPFTNDPGVVMTAGGGVTSPKYDAYLKRAFYYNATGRTVTGLGGVICQKPPTTTLPPAIEAQAKDITMTGVSVEMFAMRTVHQVLTTGRAGVLVDMSNAKGTSQRPFWLMFTAEDIIGWRTDEVGGDPEVLTEVRLRESAFAENPEDPYQPEPVQQVLVLSLEGDGATRKYVQTRWRPKQKGSKEWAMYGPVVVPLRRGAPLDFIPFVFVGPDSISPTPAKPPLIDLVNVNLSHYRNMADLEDGLHHVGVPVLVVSGAAPQEGPRSYGAGVSIELPMGGDAKLLQVNGETLGALERADERKRKLMATLGARLLEDQPRTQETATAVGMRHGGEHATIRTIAGAVEQALTMAAQVHTWWLGGEKNPAAAKAGVALNKEFANIQASPEEVKAALLVHQAGKSSFATFYERLTKGGWTRDGVSAEDELAEIEREEPMREEPPDDEMPPEAE